MILQITTTHKPATDLGYLLHKNPGRLHSVEMPFGQAHVFYSEASEERCVANLALEVDPVGLVRNRKGPSAEGGMMDQYVNDRPYAAGSFFCTAMKKLFGTAMTGRSKERPDLAEAAIPLQVRLPVVACRGGEALVRRLFEPLGYEVEVQAIALDEHFPEWGDSPYLDLRLKQSIQVNRLLRHLYVLIPVLDNEKHYWVDSDEIDKLLRSGEGWLQDHPAKEEIAKRYLRNQRNLTREALARLAVDEGEPDPDARDIENQEAEEKVEKPISLHQARLKEVFEALKTSGAKRVLDLGCGEGRLLGMLLPYAGFEEVVGVDVSYWSLEKAQQRLRLDRMPERVAKKLKLLHGSLVYRDARLAGFDAAAVVEVVEHLDVPRLAAFERVLFEFARPSTVVMTTPNREYNALFPTLPVGKLRHKDHRFEWTRAEFAAWGEGVAARHGYSFTRTDIGPLDETAGAPTQMGVFQR